MAIRFVPTVQQCSIHVKFIAHFIMGKKRDFETTSDFINYCQCGYLYAKGIGALGIRAWSQSSDSKL